MFMKIDANADGSVDWDEFTSFMLMESKGIDALQENSLRLFKWDPPGDPNKPKGSNTSDGEDSQADSGPKRSVRDREAFAPEDLGTMTRHGVRDYTHHKEPVEAIMHLPYPIDKYATGVCLCPCDRLSVYVSTVNKLQLSTVDM